MRNLERHYKLVNKEAIPCNDLNEFAESFGFDERRVDSTKIGSILVSTVFLGLDHQFGDGPPLLFETMVFGGVYDQKMNRYTTWEQAEAGHKEMADKVQKAFNEEILDPKKLEPNMPG